MQKMKSLTISLWLAVGLLAAPACSLPAPLAVSTGGGGASGSETCVDDTGGPDGGADAGSTVIVTNDITNVVTPVSCAGVGPNPNAIDRYSQGYTPDPVVVAQVQATIASMSLADEARQMRGTPYGTAFSTQYNDIQRSMD